MDSPKHLQHKPIISVNDYDKIDAQYRFATDVKALSIGNAQYDYDEISLKVWRHTGEKWTRQSEELPLHRSIDLNILLLGALMTDINSGYPKTNLREQIDDQNKVQEIKDYYLSHEIFLKPRLEELRDKLNEFLK
ncbi:DUF6530 family protein [Flavobacterium piscis]|uniref:Uncharacterized protein n=1 Tax=Flavobacterium piscis TaxID=1114874 RepID=A0ABU1Y6X7_9FLAO|nr:DUF6530 family protein [Flavobacterium piscis]MDR7209976.1 hypothetical protein [Flavobacterium piscis]